MKGSDAPRLGLRAGLRVSSNPDDGGSVGRTPYPYLPTLLNPFYAFRPPMTLDDLGEDHTSNGLWGPHSLTPGRQCCGFTTGLQFLARLRLHTIAPPLDRLLKNGA